MNLMLGKETSFWLKKKKTSVQYIRRSCEVVVVVVGLYSGVSSGHWQHGGGGSEAVCELESEFNTLGRYSSISSSVKPEQHVRQ